MTLERQKNVLLALGRYNPKLHEGVARFAGQHNWHLNAENWNARFGNTWDDLSAIN